MNEKMLEALTSAHSVAMERNEEQLEAHLDEVDNQVRESPVVTEFMNAAVANPELMTSLSGYAVATYEQLVHDSEALQEAKARLEITDPAGDIEMFASSPHFMPILTIVVNAALALMEKKDE